MKVGTRIVAIGLGRFTGARQAVLHAVVREYPEFLLAGVGASPPFALLRQKDAADERPEFGIA